MAVFFRILLLVLLVPAFCPSLAQVGVTTGAVQGGTAQQGQSIAQQSAAAREQAMAEAVQSATAQQAASGASRLAASSNQAAFAEQEGDFATKQRLEEVTGAVSCTLANFSIADPFPPSLLPHIRAFYSFLYLI